MVEVTEHEAQARFVELLRDVDGGEEIVVTRDGRSIARIVAVREPAIVVERFGLLKDEISDPGDWDDRDAEYAQPS